MTAGEHMRRDVMAKWDDNGQLAAPAVLRIGDGEPVPLHGAPVVSPDYQPGETAIILGWTSDGQAVTYTAATLELANDLLNTTARGMARAETPLAVRP